MSLDPDPLDTEEDHDLVERLRRPEEGRSQTWQHEPLATQGSRRFSLNATTFGPRSLLLPVDSTLDFLLSREDTDHNYQITINDFGPKNLSVATVSSHGFRHVDVRGTYMLSNLLQELTLAQGFGHKNLIMDEARLSENPVERLSRLIRDSFWTSLTRRLDASSIEKAAADPKDWSPHPQPRIYIPASCPEQIRYYQQIALTRPDIMLDVQVLRPSDCTPDGIRDLNAAPGILALGMETYSDKSTVITKMQGLPFIVPGGRFNELYGWDSYMESIGLIIDNRLDLAEAMVKNFCFCIKHYGKILNANRTYYLGRSQPPFLTDMALRVYEKKRYETGGEQAIDFLQQAIFAAIKEYYTIWMVEPRLDVKTGLSRYRPVGVGIPPETEATHFVHVIEPYAKKHDMEYQEFVIAYNNEVVHEPELDEYFLHDRAVRESGHDTSYRLEKVAANLATIDLNALLYKYETDIARTIDVFFGGNLFLPAEYCQSSPNAKAGGQRERAEVWYQRAEFRRSAVDRYLWNEEKGMYFDYDTVKETATEYESATIFWALWAGLATPHQAEVLVQKALPKLEVFGGIVSGTEDSRGPISLSRPSRQWDHPYGWAPHQMLAWTGFQRYGYEMTAKRLAYKWLYTITKSFTDFNGVVVEKYDVTRPNDPHKVGAEYGNQGSDFKGVAREGFGWVNASYQFGLTIVDNHMRRALGVCTTWDTFNNPKRQR